MENASKALIIAGAILLAIAIIGIGMYVYQNAADAMEGTDMSSEKVATYNQKFLNYEGLQKGTAVKTMCSTIVTHNLTATDDSEKVQVLLDQTVDAEVNVQDVDQDACTTEAINTVKGKIASGKSYKVDYGYDKTSGMITTVYITEQK